MKMSVILGICQMSLGIFLKLANGMYFHHQLDIWFEFLPQILFLFSTFGYLCVLIFIKWTVGTRRSPLILIVLINMVLPGGGGNNPNIDSYLYPYEKTIENILVVLALICVPWMLVPKPLILNFMFKRKKAQQERGMELSEESIEGHPIEDFKMSEIVVHQILETIEFVLGTLSHTASYLRLWALSLAHSELATVFWDMLFAPAMTAGVRLLDLPFLTGIGAFIGFAIWISVTVAVILLMESLSAFLHALRLHWVEFQSKFYKGDGVKFAPLSFARLHTSIEDNKEDI